jgi:V/A-type H+-transporting ATPase subunit E
MKEAQEENKIQKICDILRDETINPAKSQANEIIEKAHIEASKIVKNARKEAESLEQRALEEIAEKKRVFEASLSLACRQGIEKLKQLIEQKLFSDNLSDLLQKATSKDSVISELINNIIEGIHKEGIDLDLRAYIPKKVSARRINELLLTKIKDNLVENTVQIGDFNGGARVQLMDMKITLDISDEAINLLVADYIHSDFRDLFFNI